MSNNSNGDKRGSRSVSKEEMARLQQLASDQRKQQRDRSSLERTLDAAEAALNAFSTQEDRVIVIDDHTIMIDGEIVVLNQAEDTPPRSRSGSNSSARIASASSSAQNTPSFAVQPSSIEGIFDAKLKEASLQQQPLMGSQEGGAVSRRGSNGALRLSSSARSSLVQSILHENQYSGQQTRPARSSSSSSFSSTGNAEVRPLQSDETHSPQLDIPSIDGSVITEIPISIPGQPSTVSPKNITLKHEEEVVISAFASSGHHTPDGSLENAEMVEDVAQFKKVQIDGVAQEKGRRFQEINLNDEQDGNANEKPQMTHAVSMNALTDPSTYPDDGDDDMGPEAFADDGEDDEEEAFDSKHNLVISFNDDHANHRRKFPSNYIKTTKYTWWNFLFFFFVNQLRKISNDFFIAIMIFSFIPNVSPTSPITSVLPVIFIFGSALLREGIEEFLRFLADRRANSRKCTVIKDSKQKPVRTCDIRAGDIVMINDGEECPVDMLLISSSLANGICFIETANLDGETNLKMRKSVTETSTYDTEEKLMTLRGFVEAEKPDIKLYKFRGTLTLYPRLQDSHDEVVISAHEPFDTSSLPPVDKEQPTATQQHIAPPAAAANLKIPKDALQYPLDHNNLLLKGSVVRNTGRAFGIAVYTGKNTKMFRNQKKGATKFSFLDNRLNQLMVALLLAHQILSIVYVIVSSILQTKVVAYSFYLPYDMQIDGAALYVFKAYLTAFILLNLFIPMSLFVSLEFVKGIQIRFMEADKYLRDEYGRGMKANSSSLNADLSQIEIIFADKTGTLTENKMVFKIAATRSGFVHDEQIKPGGLFHVVTSPPTKQDPNASSPLPSPVPGDTGVHNHPLQGNSLVAPPASNSLVAIDPNKEEENKTMPFSENDQLWVHELLVNIAINNMITPHTDEKTGQIKLEGESPDEVALLKAAFANGYRLINRTDETIELDVCGKRMLYKLLTTMKFDSDRKRMSVLVQEVPLDAHGHPIPEDQLQQSGSVDSRPISADSDGSQSSAKHKKVQHARVGSHARTGSQQFFGFIKNLKKSRSKVICYTKGADNVLLPLLSSKDRQSGADKHAVELIDKFAREGLRTLLFCRKEVPKSEFESWIKRLKQAEVSSDPNRDARIADLYEEVETGFEIIGLTAIEDRLQDRVPETISFFRQANVQLWMLTGDKRETAINIGYSANLLNRDTTAVHIVDADSLKKCTFQLHRIRKRITAAKKRKQSIQAGQVTEDTDVSLSKTDVGLALAGKKDHSVIIDGNSLAFVFGNHPMLKKKRAALDSQKIVGKVIETGKRVRRETITKLDSVRRRSHIHRAPSKHDLEAKEQTGPVNVTPEKKNLTVEEKKKRLAMRQKACFNAFLDVIPDCQTVIICRATPLQKALMVRLMKRKFNKIGLAIGDGANDVSMIQEARVGVGIMGLEGSQASRAADYAIHRFHHLVRLLAVHGRYSMIRTGLFVQYSFYKNMVVTVVLLLFTCFDLFSGQTFLDSWLLTFYNLIFTLLTPFVMGLFEKDVDDKVLMRNPEIFQRLRKESVLDLRSFSLWVLQAIYHSCVIFFWVSMVDLDSGTLLRNGWTSDMWVVSTAASLCINMVINLKSILEMNSFHALNIFTILFSILSMYTFQFLYSIIIINPIDDTGNMYYVTFELFASIKFHLLCLFVVITAILPDFTFKYLRKLLFPKKSEVEQEKYVKDRRKRMWNKLTGEKKGKSGKHSRSAVAPAQQPVAELEPVDEELPVVSIVHLEENVIIESSLPHVPEDAIVEDDEEGVDDAPTDSRADENAVFNSSAAPLSPVGPANRTMILEV